MNRKARGFSLVEIAVVLVVIGVIAAMAVKSYNMIIVAKIKGELTKIDRISVAVSSFYDRFGYLPGDNGTAKGFITSDTVGVYAALQDGGFATLDDFKILNRSNELSGIWRFVRCIPKSIGYLPLPSSATTGYPTGSLCVIGDTNTDFAVASLTGAGAPESLLAGYELYYDNVDTKTGNGRGVTNDNMTRADFIKKLTNYNNVNYYIRVW